MMNRLASILLAAALSLVLAACGGASSEPATTPADPTADPTGAVTASDGPTCADVGVNVKAQLTGDSEMPPDKIDQAAEVLVTSCTEDAWSLEARQCAATASADDIEDCKVHMPAEVAAKLDARMEAIFD